MPSIQGALSLLASRLRRYRYTHRGPSLINEVLLSMERRALSEADYRQYLGEVTSDGALAQNYERLLPTLNEAIPHKAVSSWRERVTKRPHSTDIFYVLIRALDPDLVVETGVAAGNTSALILAALNRNNRGRLYSFDLPSDNVPEMDLNVSKNEIGSLIPDHYKDRWNLTVGDATYELPAKLRGMVIDVFFHDSEHSYDHMNYEYAFAAKHVRRGGLVISDDVSVNPAFFRYFEGRGNKIFLHSGTPNVGLAVL